MTSAWEGTAQAYERSFARLCAGTVEAVLDAAADEGSARGPAVVGRLLDVGAGTGELAARAVARGWSVVAVDRDTSMTRRSAGRRGLPVVRAALPRLPFPAAAFAAVTANFVVNHVPDPRAAAAELARVTAPGGRVVATIWPSTISPMNDLWNRVMLRARVEPCRAGQLTPDLDFARTCDGLGGLLIGAGLRVDRTREVSWEFRIPAAELWVAVEAGIAIVGQTYRAQDEDTRRRMRDAYAELAAAFETHGELRLPSTAVLAEATGRV